MTAVILGPIALSAFSVSASVSKVGYSTMVNAFGKGKDAVLKSKPATAVLSNICNIIWNFVAQGGKAGTVVIMMACYVVDFVCLTLCVGAAFIQQGFHGLYSSERITVEAWLWVMVIGFVLLILFTGVNSTFTVLWLLMTLGGPNGREFIVFWELLRMLMREQVQNGEAINAEAVASGEPAPNGEAVNGEVVANGEPAQNGEAVNGEAVNGEAAA
ncbi:MAG: hypothetical protein SGARI_000725 [Bacillariaceae sp.]